MTPDEEDRVRTLYSGAGDLSGGQSGDSNEVNEFLDTLIKVGALEGAALGIAKQLRHQGVDSLTSTQVAVVHRWLSEFYISACGRCGGEIPWSEMYGAYLGGGMCAYCEEEGC